MYLVKRHQTWLAFHDVPATHHATLGRRLVQSLKTPDKAKAERLASLLWLHDWSRRLRGIAIVRDNDAEAAFFRDLIAKAESDDEREALVDHVGNLASDRADDARDEAGVEASVRFAALATGRLTPLTEPLDEWLEGLEDTQKTKDMKKSTITKLALAFPHAQEIEPKALQAWLVKTAKADDLSAKTVQRILSEVRGYWRHLKSKGLVKGDPFADLTLPTSARRVASWVPFAAPDVVALLKAAKAAGDDKLANLITLAMWSGGRIEELCSLQIPEVDMKRRAFKVKDAKTAAGVREVPIHAKLQPTLKALIGKRKTGYVLDGLTANKYDDRSDAIGKRFGRLKTEMKFSKAHVFHSIRKTVVTLLENAGVLENLAADIVGHEKPRITYGLYSGGATLEVKRKALAKLRY